MVEELTMDEPQKPRRDGWEPMSLEDAQRLIDSMPPEGSTFAERVAKFTEAKMVLDGADRNRIKTAVDKVLDGPGAKNGGRPA
jgi:hypothetical protein